MGSTSGSRLAVISGVSTPISRMPNSTTAFPPSYEAAIHGASYFSGVPHPTTAPAYPTSAARVDYDHITHLAIDGDVSIVQISHESAAADGMGSNSGSGIAVISGVSAPISLLPNENRTEFEMIGFPGTATSPPSYEAAVRGAPYPTSAAKVNYDRITHLASDGDVSIMQISHESAAGDGLGSTSGSGIAVISGVSTPMSLLPNENRTEFEIIDSAGTTASPPSYEAAVHGASYLSGAPYPTTGVAYLTSATTNPTSGAPYPTTGTGYSPSAALYPSPPAPYLASGLFHSPAASGTPPPPPGPPIPFNFSQPVQRSGWQKSCGTCCGCIFFILVIALGILRIAGVFL